MKNYALDTEKYIALARQAAAEGCVLLKNDNQALPLKKGDKVAVFGRITFDYYKSGLGSGGLVNAPYVVGILDALEAEPEIEVKQELKEIYKSWIEGHPYDNGAGWGQVPWCQQEMAISEKTMEAAKGADAAIVIIGRTAGEDQDNNAKPGSYLLTDTEHEMIRQVAETFPRTTVLLNVGNIIDMKWVSECNPAAVLYVWQGGQEGGNGVCDVLTGRVTPCGKLADTIAKDIADYPSTANFGNEKKNYYQEDIYVGYRYFETFAKDKVLYPFGYGLSYTTFQMDASLGTVDADQLTVNVRVTNTGSVAGKEVVQVYVEAPQGKLGKPAKVLAGFSKTETLQPGAAAAVTLVIPKQTFASYDDSGITGHKSCYILEEGSYGVFAGSDIRNAKRIGEFTEELRVLEQLQEAYAPTEEFVRLKPKAGDGFVPAGEKVPTRTVHPTQRMAQELPAEIPYTGDKGYKLADVVDGKVDLNDFIPQLSDEDLMCLFRGEGMCSPKVTPGTAAAFGGLTEALRGFGIPAACCSDGPSGIRMDCGTRAFSLPNGTLLGCSFNLPLAKELFEMMGLELRKNRIDTLLGPGMNIHRNPLNGRNFEYISEDPLLTGKMGAVQIQGMETAGVTGTIKHFCGNNQEARRRQLESVVSERALREIYLKGFEIAVKEGNARSVMTTYGPVNGIWTAGSYDLVTTILRKEWGFEGIVMTDWWAEANREGEPSNPQMHAPMVAAGNDIFMVTQDASDHTQDNVAEALKSGDLTRGQLQRNAANILNFIMHVPAMLYEMGRISQEELEARKADDDNEFDMENLVYYKADSESGDIMVDASEFSTAKDTSVIFGIHAPEAGLYDISLTIKSDLGELAQLPVTISYDNVVKAMISIRGTEGKWVTETRDIGPNIGPTHYIKLYFGADGLVIDKIVLHLREKIELPF